MEKDGKVQEKNCVRLPLKNKEGPPENP